MKQVLSAIALCLMITLGSCKIRDCGPNEDNTVIETLHANEAYTYDLGSFGDEEGAWIERQAKHYRTSRVYREQDFSRMTYEYKPEQDYLGTDEVELRSARGSNGVTEHDRIIKTVIKFRIVP